MEPEGVQRPNVPHFKDLINPDWNQKSPRAWQHYFSLPRSLEKKDRAQLIRCIKKCALEIDPEFITNTATVIDSGTVRLPCFAFWSVQHKPVKLASMLIHHFKALIWGY